MPEKIVACGILQGELEHLLRGRGEDIIYINAALHVDEELLAGALETSLSGVSEDAPVIIGSQCHPEMKAIVARHGGRLVKSDSCIDMLLGNEKKRLDAEANTFYLTAGWLEHWREIFIEGLKWDAVDARQNFGYYDRILLLDTGITPIDDEKILEFFDYTQVPIEILPVKLEHFRMLLEDVLNK